MIKQRVGAGTVTQRRSQWRTPHTSVTDRTILSRECVVTSLYAECICERRRISDTLITDDPVLGRDGVAACLYTEPLCDWWIGGAPVARRAEGWTECVAAGLDAL